MGGGRGGKRRRRGKERAPSRKDAEQGGKAVIVRRGGKGRVKAPDAVPRTKVGGGKAAAARRAPQPGKAQIGRARAKGRRAGAQAAKSKRLQKAQRRKAPLAKRAAALNERAGKVAGQAAALARAEENAANSIEELLVMSLIKGSANSSESGVVVQDLVLSLSRAARRVGYNFGFSVGREIYGYGHANIETLFDVLDKLGMGKVLYYPAVDHAIITSIKQRANTARLGLAIHFIESGLIAGYLSGYLGTGIRVRETLCTYLNSEVCQFVAEPLAERDYSAEVAVPRLDDVTKAIAERIGSADASRIGGKEMREYLMLPSVPLMKHQMLDDSAGVLYLAGGELSRMYHKEEYADALRKIASYFDLSGVDAASRGGKRVIRLRYKEYNSMEALVRLSSSMAAGLLSGLFGSEPKARAGIGAGRAYFVEMTV